MTSSLFSPPDRGGENLPRTNEEVARIRWNLIVADEIILQGRTMAKDKFIRKVGSGPEEYAVPPVNFPVAMADGHGVHRNYIIQAQGAEYRWIRRDRSDCSPKVSAPSLPCHGLG